MLRDCGQQHSTEFFCRRALAPHKCFIAVQKRAGTAMGTELGGLGKTVCFQLLKPFSMSPSTAPVHQRPHPGRADRRALCPFRIPQIVLGVKRSGVIG
jgi:hypothetical protein